MEEEVFDIGHIPLRQPIVLRRALKQLDGVDLSGVAPESADRMLLVRAAIKAGEVRAARVSVPVNRVQIFVELHEFRTQFETFLANLCRGEFPRQPIEGRREIREEPPRESWKRQVARWVTGKRWLLPVAECLCRRREQLVSLALVSPFRPLQNPKEICDLLNFIAARRPRRLLEIGTASGGTLYLITKVAHPEATLLSVDLKINRKELLRSFARRRQRLGLIEGDSTSVATVEAVKRWFPEGIDFLFLDGDHSYEGIKNDFENYSPLVRPGGAIAFHDIVEDYETRYGVITGAWTGEVPKFWKEVKTQYRHLEFVKDYEQDGLGIGVLLIPGTQEQSEAFR